MSHKGDDTPEEQKNQIRQLPCMEVHSLSERPRVEGPGGDGNVGVRALSDT